MQVNSQRFACTIHGQDHGQSADVKHGKKQTPHGNKSRSALPGPLPSLNALKMVSCSRIRFWHKKDDIGMEVLNGVKSAVTELNVICRLYHIKAQLLRMMRTAALRTRLHSTTLLLGTHKQSQETTG
jgi:hypothetical protein